MCVTGQLQCLILAGDFTGLQKPKRRMWKGLTPSPGRPAGRFSNLRSVWCSLEASGFGSRLPAPCAGGHATSLAHCLGCKAGYVAHSFESTNSPHTRLLAISTYVNQLFKLIAQLQLPAKNDFARFCLFCPDKLSSSTPSPSNQSCAVNRS